MTTLNLETTLSKCIRKVVSMVKPKHSYYSYRLSCDDFVEIMTVLLIDSFASGFGGAFELIPMLLNDTTYLFDRSDVALCLQSIRRLLKTTVNDFDITLFFDATHLYRWCRLERKKN